MVDHLIGYGRDFQLAFRGPPGFCERLPRVPQLVSKNKNNLACEITSEKAIKVLHTQCLVPN